MIIKNITIENFQSYHESQTMDFFQWFESYYR